MQRQSQKQSGHKRDYPSGIIGGAVTSIVGSTDANGTATDRSLLRKTSANFKFKDSKTCELDSKIPSYAKAAKNWAP
jgi:hypothetical protein